MKGVLTVTFHQRKVERTAWYFKYIYKNKLVKCTACDGSGKYDTMDKKGRTPNCGCCNGTGKDWEREWMPLMV